MARANSLRCYDHYGEDRGSLMDKIRAGVDSTVGDGWHVVHYVCIAAVERLCADGSLRDTEPYSPDDRWVWPWDDKHRGFGFRL